MKKDSKFSLAITPGTIVLLSLYVLESAMFFITLGIYKKGDRSLLTFSASPAGVVVLAAILMLVTSIVVIVYVLRNDRPSITKPFATPLVLNICSVIAALTVVEVFIRVFAVTTPSGPEFANTLLLPRSWKNVASRNQTILAKASARGSFLVFDRELGWTIGTNRRSKDYNKEIARQTLTQRRKKYPKIFPLEPQRTTIEADDDIYLSSVEGIRSPRVGLAFADTRPRNRIAIIGDSFTFGLEVRYEETWGYKLELLLGSETQVLNFGVDGYGVDQAYLRYKRDVLPWHPSIVIFGVYADDLRRTMGVYGFLNFPGGEIPFPKPRFVTEGKALALINVPLPTPESIFGMKSITKLPFVEYDASFHRLEWESHLYHNAYLIRFLLSRYPRWVPPGPLVNDEAMKSVNGQIFHSFVRLARENGSIPILVYLPSMFDLLPESKGRMGVAREILRTQHISYLDLTDCVSKVSLATRFVTLHYSPVTNTAVANCLLDSIRKALQS